MRIINVYLHGQEIVLMLVNHKISRIRASLMAQWVKKPFAVRETQETWVPSLGWEDPWKRKWQPTPVFLLENSMDRGAWQAIVHSFTELDTTEPLSSQVEYMIKFKPQ